MKLTLFNNYYYGNDKTAINRHHTKVYQNENGMYFQLNKNLSGCPPFFEITGPTVDGFRGIIPTIKVGDKNYWGEGLTWKQAEKVFLQKLNAVLLTDD